MSKKNHSKVPGLIIIFVINILFVSNVLVFAAESVRSGSNFAPQKAVAPQNRNSAQSNNTVSKDAVKLFIKGVEIYGRLPKPQAVFIIAGTDPKVDGLKIDRQFFDLIFRRVEKSNLKHIRKKDNKNKDFIQW